MVDGMIWRFIHHSELARQEITKIAELKNQHWQYGITSQISWMNENIGNNDVHLVGEQELEGRVVINAYATLVKLQIKIDEMEYDAIGVGGVCVDRHIQGGGVGKQLILKANYFIRQHNCIGILLCRDKLIRFYEKCQWKIIAFKEAKVANLNYKYNIMTLNDIKQCDIITIDKNF